MNEFQSARARFATVLERLRGVVSILVGACAAALAIGSARAAVPACFPERTISIASALFDDRLEAFGGLAPGVTVRVRDEPERSKWAEVEIDDPIPINARVDRRSLVVLARADIEIEPGLSWVLAGAPLAILSGDEQRARVVMAPPLDSDKGPSPSFEVPCTLLRGTPGPESVGWDVIGPRQKGEERVSGRALSWNGTRQLESEAGKRSPPLEGTSRDWDGRRVAPVLVKLQGDRALVEVIDHRHWTRHRGWTTRAGLGLRRKTVPGVICGCAIMAPWIELTYPEVPRAKLRAPTVLRASADKRTLVTLPAESVIDLLSVEGDESLVVWRSPRTRERPFASPVTLFGRVPAAATGSIPPSAVNAIIRGRLQPTPDRRSALQSLVVKAEWKYEEISFQTQTALTADGSFRLVAPVNGRRLAVWAESRDGNRIASAETAELAPGTTLDVVLTMSARNEPGD